MAWRLPCRARGGGGPWRARGATVIKAELGEYCRWRGLYPEQLKAWWAACEQANDWESATARARGQCLTPCARGATPRRSEGSSSPARSPAPWTGTGLRRTIGPSRRWSTTYASRSAGSGMQLRDRGHDTGTRRRPPRAAALGPRAGRSHTERSRAHRSRSSKPSSLTARCSWPRPPLRQSPCTDPMSTHRAPEARASRRCPGGTHGPEGGEGVADTTSSRLEGVRPARTDGRCVNWRLAEA